MVTKYQVKDALKTNKQKVEAELERIQKFIAQPGLIITEETLGFIQDEIKAMQDYSKALGNLIIDINTSGFTKAEVKGTVTVTYVDKATKAEIANSKTITDVVGKPYTTEAATIADYTLDKEPTNKTGVITEEPISVVYEYNKVEPVNGNVIVKYVDENNVDITPMETHTEVVGTAYSFTAKDIEGYTLKTDADNKSGVYTEETITVTFVYSKDPVKVTSVELNPSATTVEVGSTTQLTPAIFPGDAANKKVTFTSSDETIATVDETGKVTGVKAGEVEITVTTEDGNFTAKSTITVNDPA